MQSRFFQNGNNLPPENNFERFLENYPEKEFWRFFVERDRYDERLNTLLNLYQILNYLTKNDETNTLDETYVSIEFMEKQIGSLTIGELYELGANDDGIISTLDNLYRLSDKKAEQLLHVINRKQGWIGFEDYESGYLTNITNAFNFILKNSSNKEKLDLDFIKTIHKLATQNVTNLLSGTMPGEFRSKDIGWGMGPNFDSLEGLKETIDYLKTVEKEWGRSGFLIYVKDLNMNATNKIIKKFGTFCDKDTNEIALEIWDLDSRDEVQVRFHTMDHSAEFKLLANPGQFLVDISNKHLEKLDESLTSARSKEEKLTAIFTYLKHTVLHHVFNDGEGRTFSMLLLQHLLIRENLLPILIKNSNIIPGYSVKELVDEYTRAEKEMELILKNPDYINSKYIIEENISTDQLLKSLPQEDQYIFNANLDEFSKTKCECLGSGHGIQSIL